MHFYFATHQFIFDVYTIVLRLLLENNITNIKYIFGSPEMCVFFKLLLQFIFHRLSGFRLYSRIKQCFII